tara:strand:+ start:1860 stop:2333 length:474 start_codon:yes stop_codon:yes gene_type:complete
MKTYLIYHIPGKKIGCTKDLYKRMSDQGFTQWEILEEHNCIYEVSDREIQLQKDYGLPVDKVPYWQSVQNRRKWQPGDAPILTSERASYMRSCVKDKSRPKSKETREKISISMSKLLKQADEIRVKYIPRKYSMQKLAKEYNVSRSTISRIINKEFY